MAKHNVKQNLRKIPKTSEKTDYDTYREFRISEILKYFPT
jgi:hypothetical protein